MPLRRRVGNGIGGRVWIGNGNADREVAERSTGSGVRRRVLHLASLQCDGVCPVRPACLGSSDAVGRNKLSTGSADRDQVRHLAELTWAGDEDVRVAESGGI